MESVVGVFTFLFFFFLGVSAVPPAGASACTGEFNQFKTCMAEAFNQLMERSDTEKMLGQVKECFIRGRCNVSDISLTSRKGGRDSQCKKQVFEELGKHIERCIQGKVPGFTFADLFIKKVPGTSIGFNLPAGGKKFGRFLKLMNSANTCPSDARGQVYQCLKPIVDSSRGLARQYITELCNAKDKCIVRMTPECKKEFDEVKKEVVGCTCDHLVPNAGKYTDEFLQCIGRVDQPNPIIKRMIEEFIPTFCKRMRDNPDVCQNMKGLIGANRALTRP